MIIEPGKAPPEWKGVRVYLKMIGYETLGEKVEAKRKIVAQRRARRQPKPCTL
jgi:hypothetical protein